MANFDNIFTKKYRRWYKEGQKDFDGLKSNTGNKIDSVKERRRIRKEEKQAQKAEQLKVKEQYTEIKQTEDNPTKIIQPLDFEDQTLFEPVNLRRIWRNKLYGEYNPDKPELRDYDKL